jgi:CRP/FNR family transcriptional regulator, cyclic AMP receptor protein
VRDVPAWNAITPTNLMYTSDTPTPEIDALNARSKELISRVLYSIAPTSSGMKLPADAYLFEGACNRAVLYLLRDGNLEYSRNGRTLFSYDEGDLVGLEAIFLHSDSRIRADFSVVVDEYSAEELLKAVREDAELSRMWNAYLVCQVTMLNELLSGLSAHQLAPKPNIRMFAPGDAIIEQGSDATEVFTMVEGEAQITVNGAEVGTIRDDEIFGALATLANTRRTASVTAVRPSLVVVLQRDEFVQLVQSRPLSMMKLMEEMARTLLALDAHVVGALTTLI